jgi:hypothetical protein
MNNRQVAPPGAPMVKLTLVGAGEPLLRLQKRLGCAASSLGVALEVEVCKTPEAVGIPYNETPAILVDGRLAFAGLRRTEEIEAWLRARFPNAPTAGVDAPRGSDRHG